MINKGCWFGTLILMSLVFATSALGQAKSIEPILWNNASDGENTFKANRKYDRERISDEFYDLRPAYQFVFQQGRYKDLPPYEFPHVIARFKWKADPRYMAEVLAFPSVRQASNKTLFDHPLIIGDAFDPSSDRRAYEIYTTPRYHKLLSIDPKDNGARTGPDASDIFFVDFTQGGGDLLINSQLLLKVIEWVQTRAVSDILVGGISMSGLSARLALLYSIPENNMHEQDLATKVRGFLSVDAPHQGASLSPRLQQISCQFSEHKKLPDAEKRNSSVVNWKDVRTPAAHQMLYSHYYRKDSDNTRCGKSNHSQILHKKFYNFIENELGENTTLGKKGFRPDIPMAAIAYSNFHKPHDDININVIHTVGNVDFDTLPGFGEREFFAGGSEGDPHHRYELYPGSTGNWYWKPFNRRGVKYVDPKGLSGELFKGTFIPLQSALALRSDFNVFNPPTRDAKALAAYSAFDYTLYMEADHNNYQREFHNNPAYRPNVDDQRYEHMVFDQQLMTAIRTSLKLLGMAESTRKAHIVTTILTPLLVN